MITQVRCILARDGVCKIKHCPHFFEHSPVLYDNAGELDSACLSPTFCQYVEKKAHCVLVTEQ